jgi:hypothetical protein
MASKEDLLARAAIEECAATLRQLSEGKPISAKWREWLDAALGPKGKRGRPPEARVVDRDTAIAVEMLRHYIANGEKGSTAVAAALAQRYVGKGRNFETKDIFDIYKNKGGAAHAEVLSERISEKDAVYEKKKWQIHQKTGERLAAGESPELVINDHTAEINKLNNPTSG